MVSLHFPPGQHFTCTDCGKCCSVPWRIKVDTPKAESMRQTNAYQALNKKGIEPLIVLEDDFELSRREDNKCHFLSDGLCSIHAEKGIRAKPSICQLYPYSLVATPDGYFVSLAYTCPAVISGVGELASSNAEGLRRTVEDAPHFFPPDLVPGDKVTLTEGNKRSYAAYLAFEKELAEIVEAQEDSVAAILLGAATALISAPHEGQLSLNRAKPVLVRNVLEQLTDLLPIFVVNTIASLEEKARPELRQELAETLIGPGETFQSKILGCAVPNYQTGLLSDQLARSVLKRYVQDKLWGKILITGPTLVVRLLLLTVSLEVFHFYYAALKASTKTLHFSAEHVEWCFDLIETDLMVHHELVIPLMEEWERVGLEFVEQISGL